MKRLHRLSRRRAGFALAALAALTTLGAATGARAQGTDGYPAKPVTLVVTWPVGGFADLLGRTVALQLGQALGQPVVVDNKGGANGVIGAAAVAKAPADGYTLMFQSVTSHAINPAIYAKLPYNTDSDLVPLAVIASVPLLLVGHPGFAAKTVPQLVELAKRQPDSIAYASFGNGSASHLAGALFANQAGLKMTHIPYRGGGPAMTDTLGGQVPLYFSAFGLALPQVQAGKLVALGITSSARARQLPDVPTLEEAGGLRGYEMAITYAVWAPAGLKPEVLATLAKALRQVVGSAAFRDKLADEGAEPLTVLTPADSLAFFNKERSRLTQIARDNAIKAE
jgi:tripartite-type tricarboxylate transporter receptor subunit TctC